MGRRTSRRIVCAGAALAAAPFAVRSAVRQALARSLPKTSGALALPCLERPVEVIRDRFGIPHIFASGLLDLVRAQGYVHAQDRLFQMEMLRRFACGRLAEVAGRRGLELDRLVRRLGIGVAAAGEAACADERAAALADAYVEGVNAFLDGVQPLPFELRLMGVRPDSWRRADVYAPGKALSLGLCVNWESELLRMQIAEKLGADRLAQLEPDLPDYLPQIISPDLIDAASRGSSAGGLSAGGGSNNWVVSGSRTRSGKPLLANDPHLLLTIPCVWHAQHLSWDDGALVGLTIPGAPLVVAGRNDQVAWGVTNAIVDTQDLYIERFHPAGDHRYEVDGSWVRAEVRHEHIEVRGRRRPLVETVLCTRHGPVIVEPDPETHEALALRWSALEPGHTLRALIDLAHARSVEEADKALDRFAGPPQNFVLADAHGDVGYRLAGGPVPVRRRGEGLVPVPGWTSANEWRGWIAQDQLPRARNPGRGFIVTANNRIVGDEYPHFLGADYLNGYRARRIEMLLEQNEHVDVEDCVRMQADQLSLPGLELAKIAAALHSDDPLEQRALDLLAQWDGGYGADSEAGAVYGVLMRKLQEEAFSELGDDLLHFLGAGRTEVAQGLGFFERTRPMILDLLAERDDSFFGDDRTWQQVCSRALAATVRALGRSSARWRWGKLHHVRFEHPFDRLPILGHLFSRGPYPVGGDTDTVWQMAWPIESPYGPHAFGPSARAVYDLSDPDGNRVLIAPGQSGHIASGHYDDMIERWRSGETVPLVMSRDAVESVAEDRLELLPRRSD